MSPSETPVEATDCGTRLSVPVVGVVSEITELSI